MKKTLALCASALLAFASVPKAHAIFGVGDIVLDPSNLAQNILSAERALEQIQNQIQSLTNEAQMLLNEAKNLEHLDFNVVDRLRAKIEMTQSLFGEAQGLAYTVDELRQQFAQLYPSVYAQNLTLDQLSVEAHHRWENSRSALDTALQLQSRARENFGEDEAVLSDLVAQSQGAIGALQATQATNQLLALLARQQIQGQQIAISQDRAVATEEARRIAEVERSRELRRRFMTRETRYAPEAFVGL